MFGKKEMVFAIVMSLMGGYAIGYSKARERFVSALAEAALKNKVEENKKP